MSERICECHGKPMRKNGTHRGKINWVCRKTMSAKDNARFKSRSKALMEERYREGCSWPLCSIADLDMLTLDHAPALGEKLFELSSGSCRSVGVAKFKQELEKTQVLCANHHQKVTKMRLRNEPLPQGIL